MEHFKRAFLVVQRNTERSQKWDQTGVDSTVHFNGIHNSSWEELGWPVSRLCKNEFYTVLLHPCPHDDFYRFPQVSFTTLGKFYTVNEHCSFHFVHLFRLRSGALLVGLAHTKDRKSCLLSRVHHLGDTAQRSRSINVLLDFSMTWS